MWQEIKEKSIKDGSSLKGHYFHHYFLDKYKRNYKIKYKFKLIKTFLIEIIAININKTFLIKIMNEINIYYIYLTTIKFLIIVKKLLININIKT